MNRERALKVVLVIVGLFFVAGIYPLVQPNQSEVLQMMLSVYITLGVFLLLASRNPGESEPDCFHRMVQLCARRGDDGAGPARRERTLAPPEGRGRVCHNRNSADRACAGKGEGRSD